MFKLELGKFCFKFDNNLLATAFNNYFTDLHSIHSHNTTNSTNRFFLNTQNNKAGYTTINYLGAKLWNNIPNKIKESKTISTFTKNYKKYLLENYQ